MKYSGREVHRGGGDLVHPSARWGDLVDGSARHRGLAGRTAAVALTHAWLAVVTDAQLAIMRQGHGEWRGKGRSSNGLDEPGRQRLRNRLSELLTQGAVARCPSGCPTPVVKAEGCNVL